MNNEYFEYNVMLKMSKIIIIIDKIADKNIQISRINIDYDIKFCYNSLRKRNN